MLLKISEEFQKPETVSFIFEPWGNFLAQAVQGALGIHWA